MVSGNKFFKHETQKTNTYQKIEIFFLLKSKTDIN